MSAPSRKIRSRSRATDSPSVAAIASTWLSRTMEIFWLLTVGFVLVLFAPPDLMLFTDVPKVVLLRVLTGLMALLWIVEWALKPVGGRSAEESLSAQFKRWLGQGLSSWIILVATLFLVANIVSALLSPALSVSLWGVNPGRDGYGLYNAASYYLLFIVIATRLKTRAQLARLLGVIVGAATLASFYGILQHFNADPFGLPYEVRTGSSFGNPLFAASFLTMTIPLSVGMGLASSIRARSLWTSAGWVALVTLQMAAIVFTLSRGPWFALGIALATLTALVWLIAGNRALIRGFLILGAALVFTAGIVLIPVSDVPTDSTARSVFDRALPRLVGVNVNLTSGNGFSGRISIWKRSASVILGRPWATPDQRTFPPLRHMVGYGPEMFLYALPLRWDPDSHDAVNASAHNQPLHITVELGLLGLLTYGGLLIALAAGGTRWLLRKRASLEAVDSLIYAALLAAVVGRIVEQMLGVARVSDTLMFWTLAAALVALISMTRAGDMSEQAEGQPRLTGAGAWRWGVALAIIAVGILLLWQRNVPYAQAATLGSQAVSTFRQGDLVSGLALMDRAIASAPDVEAYYFIRVEMMNAIATRDQSEEIEVALQQYALSRAALDANRLSHSARASLAASALKLARLGVQDKGQESIQLYRELIQMLPGYEPIYNDLATAHLILSHPVDALAVLDEYASFTEGRATPSPVSHYLRGVAYQDIRRVDEAVTSLEQFVDASPETEPAISYVAPAHRRLADLYESLGQQDKRDKHAAIYRRLKQ